jgi:hypothetical protein
MSEYRLSDRKKTPHENKETRERRSPERRMGSRGKKEVILLIAAVGFILLMLIVGIKLLSGPLPGYLVFMGMGFPILATIATILMLIKKIKEFKILNKIDFLNLEDKKIV